MRELVLVHLLHWDQAGVFAVGTGGDHALFADEQASVGLGTGGRVLLERFLLCPFEDLAGAFVPDLLRSTIAAATTAATACSLTLGTSGAGQVAQEFAIGNAGQFGLLFERVIPEEL